MKLHVKRSTASFLAAMAFGSGAAVYMGCTVTSGTIDDDNGGTGTRFDAGTDAGDGGTTTTNPDAAPVGTVCQDLKQKEQLVGDACQACLETTCCAQLKGCYNVVPPDNTTVDCDTYARCVGPSEGGGNDCTVLDPAQDAGADCELCRTAAAPGVVEGFNAIFTCASTNCQTECGL